MQLGPSYKFCYMTSKVELVGYQMSGGKQVASQPYFSLTQQHAQHISPSLILGGDFVCLNFNIYASILLLHSMILQTPPGRARCQKPEGEDSPVRNATIIERIRNNQKFGKTKTKTEGQYIYQFPPYALHNLIITFLAMSLSCLHFTPSNLFVLPCYA